MFGLAKRTLNRATNTAKKSVSRDKVEAVIAGSVYVVGKDGVSDAEMDKIRSGVGNNKDLAAFSSSEVLQMAARFADAIEKGPRAAKIAIRKEVQEGGAASPEDAEMIFSTILDVADQGGLSDQEVLAAKEVAEWLGITDLKPYDL